MNWKIKLLLMIFIVFIVSCGTPEPGPEPTPTPEPTPVPAPVDDSTKVNKPDGTDSLEIKVGGPCIYDTIDVYTVVDSIKYVDSIKCTRVYFSVFTKSENEQKRNYTKHLKDINCILHKFISVGDTISGIYLRKISGGCDPILLELLDGKEKCFYY